MSMVRYLVLAVLLAASPAWAQSSGYVGLIDRLSGTVSAKAANGTSFQPAAFSRVRSGDEFSVPAGAEMQVVFFESRKRELWQGPAQFRIGAGGSEALSGKAAASEVKGAPSRVALAAAGNVQRIGGLTLRGGPGKVPDDAAIAQAEADYAAWVAGADPQDILPELYMVGFLQERRDTGLLAPYVKTMLRKQPGNPDVKALAERLGIAAP